MLSNYRYDLYRLRFELNCRGIMLYCHAAVYAPAILRKRQPFIFRLLLSEMKFNRYERLKI